MSAEQDSRVDILQERFAPAQTPNREVPVESPRIEFRNIEVTDGLRIDMLCASDGLADGPSEFPLWFEFSRPVALTDDVLAVALSTLCGKAFASIRMDLSPSARTLAYLRSFTGAEVSVAGSGEHAEVARAGQTLSFSGGFDSLAALALMPEGTSLVSMDFGGRFGREREFFERFETTVVSTNLIETALRRNSWSFMGIGAILTSLDSRSEYLTFGSILEAGADNLNVTPVASLNRTFPPFREAGFTNAAYVAGLTEIGTLLVMAHFKRDLISESLISLASPGEEKLYRKKVLADIVARRFDFDIDLPEVVKPRRPHFTFGQNITVDLLTYYVAKRAGEDTVNELVADIPADLLGLSERLDLTFFERANPTLYVNFPAPLVAGLYGRLADAGIRFYTEKDWREFAQVREHLAPYHAAIASEPAPRASRATQ